MDLGLPPVSPLPDNVWDDISKTSGWCWRQKANLIYSLCSDPKVTSAVEVGVFGGRSLLPMCLGVTQHGGVGVGYDPYEKHNVYMVDQKYWDNLNYAGLMDEARRLLERHGINPDWIQKKRSVEAWLSHPAGVQFIHIDGSHYMLDTVADLALWAKKLDLGGWLLIDDTNYQAIIDSAVILKPGGFEYHTTTFNDAPGSGGEAQLWKKISCEHQ